MSRGTSSKKQTLSGAKLLASVFVAPLLAVLFWQSNAPTCAGIFALLTLVFWFVAYLRIAALARGIRGAIPSRQHTTPVDSEAAPRTLKPADDSSTMFL